MPLKFLNSAISIAVLSFFLAIMIFMDVVDDRITTQSDETQTDISFEDVMKTKAIETFEDVSNNEVEPIEEQTAENTQAIRTNGITDVTSNTSSSTEMSEFSESDRKHFVQESTDTSFSSITLSIAEGFKELSDDPYNLPCLLQDEIKFGNDESQCNIQLSNQTTNAMNIIPDEQGIQVDSESNDELPMLAPGFVKNAAKFWENKLSGTMRTTTVLGNNS